MLKSWSDRHYLLYCHNANFVLENSLKNLKLHLEWVNNPKWHTVTDRVLEILVRNHIINENLNNIILYKETRNYL